MERKSELHLERQWERYLLSVAEGMPNSEYKEAGLAGIAHALMRLDSIEASRCGVADSSGKGRIW